MVRATVVTGMLSRRVLHERGSAVEVDSGALLEARGGWDGDVDGAVEWLQETPENRGGAVAENRAITAGENSSHEAPVEAEAPVAHRIDTLMKAVKTTLSRSFRCSSPSQPQVFELIR